MSVTALNNQMQEKMTIRLSELRGRVIGKMVGAGERIKARPQLPGDDSWKNIQGHQVMKQNDDGATFLGWMTGIPGMSDTIGAVVDVAVDLYGDRRSTHMRPQDDKTYAPKAQARILDQNRQDYSLFRNLEKKLDLLNAAIASGNQWGLMDHGSGELKILDDSCVVTAPKPDYARTKDMNVLATAILQQSVNGYSPRLTASI